MVTKRHLIGVRSNGPPAHRRVVPPANGTMTTTTCSTLMRRRRRVLRRHSDLYSAIGGRIVKAAAVPAGRSWMWTLGFGHHEDRTPTHGYEPTREAAMAAFAKSWRRDRI